MPSEIDYHIYQFEGRLSGQLLGPDDVERTDLPISIRFENGMPAWRCTTSKVGKRSRC
jgi:hypothetical protein